MVEQLYISKYVGETHKIKYERLKYGIKSDIKQFLPFVSKSTI